MSENNEVEHAREGSAAYDNGDPNEYVHVGPTDGAAGEEVSVFVESGNDYANQEEHIEKSDGASVSAGDSIQHAPNDFKVTEDGAKEDMFVDCPDEIETSDTQLTLEGKDDVVETQVKELDNVTQVHDSMVEMEHLRHMLEKTAAERDRFAKKYEEEKAAFMKHLTQLHYQLEALNEQPTSLNKNDGGLVDHRYRPDTGDEEQDVINKCYKYLETFSDERSQTEGTIKELHAIFSLKDQEIESLTAKVTELSVSHESSEIQLEKYKHIEDIANRMLTFLASAVDQEEMLDVSLTSKISHVEKVVILLLEKYSLFRSEIDQLRCCLAEFAPDTSMQDEVGIFVTARDNISEFRRKIKDLDRKLSEAEDVNKQLIEQLDNHKAIVENANAEIGKLNAELEQEKAKLANTKEKLSLAVTKGKALVQQRDSLKQSLAGKTSELERCSNELQEKSSALEAAEQSKDLLMKSETLATSLQDALMQRDAILQKCGEILSEAAATEEIQPKDIIEQVRWLLDERNAMKSISLEFHRLTDSLSSFDFPESVKSTGFDVQVGWLLESFNVAKEEAAEWQDEIFRTREAVSNDIDRLIILLLVEKQEKDYLQAELEDLRSKYEGIVEKEYHASMEKDRIVNKLLEASGIVINDEEKDYQPLSGMATIIDKCIAKIKDDSSSSFDFSHIEVENWEKIQSFLYIRNMEVALYSHICEEEMLDRAEATCLSNELMVSRNELSVLKDDKDALQKDLGRSEEKVALLREKLSMAVKKGKGLVQERENLKKMLDEKNTEIENLKSELQQQVSVSNDCKDQINKLSADVELIPKLVADLVAIGEQKDQVEKFLVESNSMLQRVFESIDSIVLPIDSVFEDSVEKVKWLAGYFSDCQSAKVQMEQELGKVKDEASVLASKLEGVLINSKSLQDALSVAEVKISELLDKKKELEISKTHVEQELQKAIEEASSLTNKVAEVCASQKSLEDALQMAENNISMLINEKEEALASGAAAEMELQKVKEEIFVHTSKLSEADKIIQSLEDALSQAQKNVSLLADDNSKVISDKTDLEQEMKKLKEEVDSHVVRFTDANLTIKSLEDALVNAEGRISDLLNEKNNAEEEVSALNFKLNACMQELAGTHGNLDNRSMELSGQLTSLRRLIKDETLSSFLRQSFEKKIGSLNDMNLLLTEIRDYILETDSAMLQNDPAMEDGPSVSTVLSAGLDNLLNVEMANGEDITTDGDSIIFHIGKTVEGLHQRDKVLADKVEKFSTCMDNLIGSLLTKLQATKHSFITMQELVKSLKQKVNDMEMDRQAQEDKLFMLESDIGILLPACTDATKELESEVQNSLSVLRSNSELGELNESLSMELGTVGLDAVVGDQLNRDSNKYVKATEGLLFAARQSRNLNMHFQNVVNKMIAAIEYLQNELKENKATSDSVLEERDLYQNKLSKLESDIGASENLRNEMRLRLKEYQEKEKKLNEREAELSSLYATTSLKNVQEAEDSLLSVAEMKSLFDKITGIEVPRSQLEAGDLQALNSADVRKLFYIVDNYTGLKHQTSLLSHEKEKLQSTLEKQVLEIEHLKEEIEEQYKDKNDSKKMNKELVDLAIGLEKIIQKLGGNELMEHQNVAVSGLLPVLDKLVMATKMESENFKSKAEELGVKLLGTQKVVDDLSRKVRFLEDSTQVRVASPETVQETGIFESSSSPTQSEISEIQDMGPVSKDKAIPSVPSAVHPRTLKKGSADHLAISIDSDSERLINEEVNEDKGHVFKSLNTSGLIPIQAKMIADRVDGMWVSGSRALMSHPRARLGAVAYSLLLHLWLLATIL